MSEHWRKRLDGGDCAAVSRPRTGMAARAGGKQGKQDLAKGLRPLNSTLARAGFQKMAHVDLFTLNEAAVLAETEIDFVQKLVEDEAVDVVYGREGRRTLRMVDGTGVISIAVLNEADIPLPKAAKRRVFSYLLDTNLFTDPCGTKIPDNNYIDLTRSYSEKLETSHTYPKYSQYDTQYNILLIPISHHVFIDGRERIGRTTKLLRSYIPNRRDWIVRDPDIKGGVPILKGTRMTVYSVEGRVRHGDSLDEIASENPHIPIEALQAAVLYARAHPMLGRPGGKPWRAA